MKARMSAMICLLCVLGSADLTRAEDPYSQRVADPYALSDGLPNMSSGTLEPYLSFFAGVGIPFSQDRRDQGHSRVLDQATACWVVEQVTQTPQIPVKVLYGHWQQQGRPLPSLSVIYRHLRRQGLDRASLRAGRLESGPTKAFETPHVNDLWMVDFSPGPTLRLGDQSLPTHLCVLIDDHSRLLPFAGYYRQANTEAFHHALKEALLRRGLPRKLYVDNGPAFRSFHLQQITASLGIALIHAKPYQPQGKGKIERFFRTVRSDFLPGVRAKTLDDLNLAFDC